MAIIVEDHAVQWELPFVHVNTQVFSSTQVEGNLQIFVFFKKTCDRVRNGK